MLRPDACRVACAVLALACNTGLARTVAQSTASASNSMVVESSGVFTVPAAAFDATGTVEITIEAVPTRLDVSVHVASGELLGVASSAVGRASLRASRPPNSHERAYVVVRPAVPTPVHVSIAAVAPDAPVRPDAGSAAAATIQVGPAVTSSITRRIVARSESYAAMGFVATAVSIGETSIPSPPSEHRCAFLLVSIQAGAASIAGTRVESDSDATLFVCDVHATIAVTALEGRPRIASAWMTPRSDVESSEIPSEFLLRNELASRGFAVDFVMEIHALAPARFAVSTLDVHAGECVAVAALGRTSIVSVSLSAPSGAVVASSRSIDPASHVYYCSERDESLTMWFRALGAETDATSVVARQAR